jgi:hypothetical protein
MSEKTNVVAILEDELTDEALDRTDHTDIRVSTSCASCIRQ